MVHINVLSLSVCAVTGVILALVLKSTGSSMGTFVSVVLCVGTAMLVFNGLTQESICLLPVLIRNI